MSSPRTMVAQPTVLGHTPRCVGNVRTSYPIRGTRFQHRCPPLPDRDRGPRVGRLATVNSLKPDAAWIRARSARGGEAAVCLLVGVRG